MTYRGFDSFVRRMRLVLTSCLAVLLLAACKVDVDDIVFEEDNAPIKTLSKEDAVRIVMRAVNRDESWKPDFMALSYLDGSLMGESVGYGVDGPESHLFYEDPGSDISFVVSFGRSDRPSGLSITAYKRTSYAICLYKPVDESRQTVDGLNVIAAGFGHRIGRDGLNGRPYVTGKVRISTAREFVAHAMSASLLYLDCNG